MDYGLKVSEEEKDAISSILDDTSFDSRYYSLMLLEKRSETVTATPGGDTSGTSDYSHSYGYAPFTMAYVDYTAEGAETALVPYQYKTAWGGGDLTTSFGLSIYEDKFRFTWNIFYAVGGMPTNIPSNLTFYITLHIYSFPLGYET